MVKKFLHFLWEKSFLQYFIVGCTSFLLDFFSLIFFREVLNFNPVLSVACNQVITLTFVFLLNKFWSFKAVGRTKHQVARFFVLAAFNYCFAILWMWLFTKHISVSLHLNILGQTRDLWYLLVRVANIFLAISWNFFTYKYWVYKK